MPGRHKGDSRQFHELSWADQARAVSAQILNLEAAIRHRVRTSADPAATLETHLAQVRRLATRLAR